MKVKKLMENLKKYDEDLEVYDGCGLEIEEVFERILEDTNYPYNRPDKQVLIIS